MRRSVRAIWFCAVALAAMFSRAAGGQSLPALSVTGEITEGDRDAKFDYTSIDSTLRRLYVARGTGVMSVDLTTGTVTPVLVPGVHTHAVTVLPGGRLLSTNGDSDTATLADGADGHIIAQIPTVPKPDSATYDPATGLVFVNGEAGDMTLIDARTGASAGRMSLKGELEFAVVDGRGKLYVNMKDTAEIAVIDTAARQEVARYKLPGCKDPSGLALDPASRVLVSACDNEKAVALDAADGSVLASVDIDRKPDAVIFDADRKLFWIPCARDATLIALSEADRAVHVLGKIKTAIGAHTGALDPVTGKLYLPAADFGIRLVPPGFEQQKGTFRILVLGAAS